MSDESRVALVRAAGLATQAPYAYAAVTPPGRQFVFTAGACPLDAAGETVFPGDVAAQARQVMDNLEVALRAAGAELRDVAKTTVYVASARREDLVAAWDVVRERFGNHDAPSTLLGVAALGYPDQLVEVEAVASVAVSRSLSEASTRRVATDGPGATQPPTARESRAVPPTH